MDGIRGRGAAHMKFEAYSQEELEEMRLAVTSKHHHPEGTLRVPASSIDRWLQTVADRDAEIERLTRDLNRAEGLHQDQAEALPVMERIPTFQALDEQGQKFSLIYCPTESRYHPHPYLVLKHGLGAPYVADLQTGKLKGVEGCRGCTLQLCPTGLKRLRKSVAKTPVGTAA